MTKRIHSWATSAKTLEYRARLLTKFSCAVEGCKMRPFTAPAGEGVKRMAQHRKEAHPSTRRDT